MGQGRERFGRGDSRNDCKDMASEIGEEPGLCGGSNPRVGNSKMNGGFSNAKYSNI